jgi:hypothetical protein
VPIRGIRGSPAGRFRVLRVFRGYHRIVGSASVSSACSVGGSFRWRVELRLDWIACWSDPADAEVIPPTEPPNPLTTDSADCHRSNPCSSAAFVVLRLVDSCPSSISWLPSDRGIGFRVVRVFRGRILSRKLQTPKVQTPKGRKRSKVQSNQGSHRSSRIRIQSVLIRGIRGSPTSDFRVLNLKPKL